MPTSGVKTWCVVSLVALALGTGCRSNPATRQARLASDRQAPIARAVCLRGLANVFSTGLNELAERLEEEGVDAQAISGWSWPGVADDIVANHGDAAPPLVLVGHSYGADDAIRMSDELKKHGVEVDLLVLLDATSPPKVPDNVRRCVHLYRRSLLGYMAPPVFAGNPVEPARGNDTTKIINEPIRPELFGKSARLIRHFNIDQRSEIHDYVIAEVLGVCGLTRKSQQADAGGSARLNRATGRLTR